MAKSIIEKGSLGKCHKPNDFEIEKIDLFGNAIKKEKTNDILLISECITDALIKHLTENDIIVKLDPLGEYVDKNGFKYKIVDITNVLLTDVD